MKLIVHPKKNPNLNLITLANRKCTQIRNGIFFSFYSRFSFANKKFSLKMYQKNHPLFRKE